jgi:putative oxidoreductase
MKRLFLMGPLVFGGFFLYNGIHQLQQRRELAQYAGAKNVPQPELAVTASGAALILGGGSILLGVKPKLGAAMVAGFLAGVSRVMHDFWKVGDPNQRTSEMINFGKNLALLGAALALMAVREPWPASIPVSRRKTRLHEWREIEAA